jgi:hypothetical protein
LLDDLVVKEAILGVDDSRQSRESGCRNGVGAAPTVGKYEVRFGDPQQLRQRP